MGALTAPTPPPADRDHVGADVRLPDQRRRVLKECRRWETVERGIIFIKTVAISKVDRDVVPQPVGRSTARPDMIAVGNLHEPCRAAIHQQCSVLPRPSSGSDGVTGHLTAKREQPAVSPVKCYVGNCVPRGPRAETHHPVEWERRRVSLDVMVDRRPEPQSNRCRLRRAEVNAGHDAKTKIVAFRYSILRVVWLRATVEDRNIEIAPRDLPPGPERPGRKERVLR